MSESNSNKQWKRVPFDIELAKKIVSGEVVGRLTCDSKEYAIIGVIELPEETPKTQAELCEEAWLEDRKKHEFKPFDKVLVRDYDYQVWKCDIFSHMTDENEYACVSCYPKQCIPYEGHEHLVGITYNPE